MSLDGRTRLRLGAAAHRLPRWLAVLFPFSIVGTLFGQGFLVPPPVAPNASAVPTMGNVSGNTRAVAGQNDAQIIGGMNGEATGNAAAQPNGEAAVPAGTEGETSGAAAAPLAAPVTSLMQWGALHLHARANYQFLYAAGIHSEPGNSADTFTHTITPGLDLDLGPHVRLSYSPSIRFYSQKDFHNTVDHFASLSANAGYGDWTLGLSQGFSMTDEPLVQTSSQTQQKDYSTGLTAQYQLNDQMFLNTIAGVNLLSVNGTNVFSGPASNSANSTLTDSQTYSGAEWFGYTFNEKLSGSVGVAVDYTEQNGGFTSLDEEYCGRFDWRPGEKLTVSATGGFEDRQFLNSSTPDLWTPIFNAGISYRLLDHTSLSLSASRTVDASLFQHLITESSMVGVGVQQRLLGLMSLSLGFGYSKSDFKSTTGKLVTSRSDEGTSYSAGLSVPFREHWNFAGFYEYSQNTSSAGGFGYSSSQVGMALSWAY